jgi:DNA-binding transcriptional regulator PaaX
MKMVAKKQSRVKIGEVAKSVLQIVAGVGIISMVVIAPKTATLLEPFLKGKKYSSKQVINNNIDSLIKSGLLKRTLAKDGTPAIELTSKGKWEVGIRKNLLSGTPPEKKWDSKWRVVIFDVPNSKGKIRNELRRGMKLFGFYPLQKSVWVYPYPCDDFISLLKSYLGVSNDVLVMEVSKIENDRELRRHFRL